MIEYETVLKLIAEAGLNPDHVARIEIDTAGVTFDVYVTAPDGQLLSFQNAPMYVQMRAEIHRPDDHVHEGDKDHVHE